MKKYTDIGQFRNVVHAIQTTSDFLGKDESGEPIYRHDKPYPILKFRGTVKTHGTNSSICKYKDGTYVFQSRERELSLTSDNSSFMNEMMLKNYRKLFDDIEFNDHCCIYGEWVGKGIQKNVAVSELPKTFIIFAIKIDDEYVDMINYSDLSIPEERIYNILDFIHWYVNIDFNNPEEMSNRLMDLVKDVENECPVGKYFGVSGIGEGIVFEYINGKERYIFKMKGDKHAGKSKVKTPKIYDENDLEKVKLIKNTVSMVTPVWRLSQMLEKTFDLNNGGIIERERMGDYIRNVIADIIKEDLDIISNAGLTIKDVSKAVSDISRLYLFEQENKY